MLPRQRIGQLGADLQMLELFAIGQQVEEEDFHRAAPPSVRDRRLPWGIGTGIGKPGVARCPGRAFARSRIYDGFGRNGVGGAEGDRTPDLDSANVALSHLSYGPDRARTMGGGARIRQVGGRLFLHPLGQRLG